MPTRKLLLKYILLLSIALIWGSQFMLNKIILRDFTPTGLTFFRAFLGYISLCALSFYIYKTNKNKNKNKTERYGLKIKPNLNYFLILFLIAFLEATLPFYLISYGQLAVPSSITAVIMASIALFTLILTRLFIRHEPISKLKLFGIISGFFGVFILFSPSLLGFFSGTHIDNFKLLLSELAILTAAFCFSCSLILLRKYGQRKNDSPVLTAKTILGMASFQIGFLSLGLFLFNSLKNHHSITQITSLLFVGHLPHLNSIISLLLLGLFAGGVVYILYIQLIRLAGTTFTGLTNYLVPFVGVILGSYLLGEAIGPTTWVALGIILISLAACEF